MKLTDLYSLFELSPVPIWVFDVQTLRFLDVNIAAITSYGYSKAEFLSMTINDIRPKEDIEHIKEIVKENGQTGIFYKNTFRHCRKNGEIIDVEIASNLITFDGKNARLVLALDISEKLRAENELFKNEERFKALVQDGSDMITIIDEEFKYKYVSPASKRVFGVEPQFFIGKYAFEYIHPDDRAQVEKEARKIWTKKHIQLSPYRYRDLTNNWLWIETRATNLFEDKAVEGIVCTSKDITERIEHEKILKENIERYNIVSKATSDIIWDCNFAADKIIWNRAIKGILKYTGKRQTTYQWWKEQIHPEDRDRVIKRLDEHLARGLSKWMDEYRFLCGDGTYKYIFDRGFLVVNEDGVADRMIGAMQDITARKQEEAWSKLLESVVINASDGILITDAAMPPLIIYVNDALLKMSGYTRKELIGNYPDILHGTQVQQPALLKLKNAVEKQEPCNLELINVTKDGKNYYVSINLTPIFEEGKLERWISIQRDVSEERRYVNEIKEQNEKLKEVSWIQSHVFRAPLSRIMGLVEVAKLASTAEEKEKILDYILSSATELDLVIKDITAKTKIDKNKEE